MELQPQLCDSGPRAHGALVERLQKVVQEQVSLGLGDLNAYPCLSQPGRIPVTGFQTEYNTACFRMNATVWKESHVPLPSLTSYAILEIIGLSLKAKAWPGLPSPRL